MRMYTYILGVIMMLSTSAFAYDYSAAHLDEVFVALQNSNVVIEVPVSVSGSNLLGELKGSVWSQRKIIKDSSVIEIKSVYDTSAIVDYLIETYCGVKYTIPGPITFVTYELPDFTVKLPNESFVMDKVHISTVYTELTRDGKKLMEREINFVCEDI